MPTMPPPAATLSVEKVGGMAMFGGPHLQSHGSYAYADLSEADRKTVDALFKHRGKPIEGTPDEFRYKLSRPGAHGVETITVPASRLPKVLADAVVDRLR